MALMAGPLAWLVLRAIVGFGCSGLFITTESWLDAKARGLLLGITVAGELRFSKPCSSPATGPRLAAALNSSAAGKTEFAAGSALEEAGFATIGAGQSTFAPESSFPLTARGVGTFILGSVTKTSRWAASPDTASGRRS